MKLERIEILVNKNTGEEFKEEDIVKIKTELMSCVGRITYIDTSFLEIDASNDFHSCVESINFKDIEEIEKFLS